MPSTREIRAGAAYIELFTEDSRFVRGLRLAEHRLRAFGQKASRIGKRLLAFSGAAALPIALATRTFAGFEDQMKAVQAVTGATGQAFDRLNDQAKDLGRTTSFTAAQVAAGMLNLGRAGFDPAEIEAAIPAVLNLARATGTELDQAADIAAGTLRAFGLEARQTGQVVDVLVATANNSAQTLEDLGESLKYVAPIAAEAGETIQSTAKAIGVLANMQIKGSMAGTSLRKVLLSLTDPAVQKKLAEMGVDAIDAAGNLRPVGEVLSEIGRKMAQMGSGQRLGLMNTLFGQRAAASAVKIATTDFDQLSEAIDAADGVAARTARTMDSGLGGSFRRLMSAVEGVMIAVGEALAGALGGVADKIAKVAVHIAQFISKNKQWVVGVAATIVAIAGAGAALVALGVAAQAAAFVFGGIATILSAVGTVLGLIAGLVGALLTPLGAVSAAVIALGAYLVKATGVGGKAIEWLGEKFSELRDAASKAFQGISDALAAGDMALAGKILWLSLKVEWTKGVNALRETWIGFKEIFLSSWTDAVFGLAKIFTKGVALMQGTWARFSSFVVEKWKGAEQTLAEGLAHVVADFEGLDPDQVIKNVREDYARERRGRREATTGRLAEIDRQREGTLSELERRRKETHQERQQHFGSQLAQQQRELQDVIRQRDEAIARAGRASEEPQMESNADVLRKQIEYSASASRVAPLAAGTSVAGTFSAFAAERFGGSTAADRTAKATEETAKNTRKLEERARLKQGIPVI